MQKYRTRPRKQLDWMKDVKVGDLIGKSLASVRVVRHLSRFPDGDLRCVSLVIQKCSWTHRYYTVLNYIDLRLLGFKKFGHLKNLDSEIDRQIAKDVSYEHRFDNRLDCCDVKGLR